VSSPTNVLRRSRCPHRLMFFAVVGVLTDYEYFHQFYIKVI